MQALVEQEIEFEESRLGNLSDRLCPTHGLHYNPLVTDSCARCDEEREQERQARLALLIVAMVLLAIATVIVQVTWLYFQYPADVQGGTTVVETLSVSAWN